MSVFLIKPIQSCLKLQSASASFQYRTSACAEIISSHCGGTGTCCLWLEPAVARKATSCPLSVLLLECLYQSGPCSLILQRGLARPLSDEKGEDRSS